MIHTPRTFRCCRELLGKPKLTAVCSAFVVFCGAAHTLMAEELTVPDTGEKMKIFLPLPAHDAGIRLLATASLSNGEDRLAVCRLSKEPRYAAIPLMEGDLSLLQEAGGALISDTGRGQMLLPLSGDVTRALQSVDMLEEELKRNEQQLVVLKAEGDSLSKEEARLKADAEVIGNFARIIDARSRSEKLRAELRLSEHENDLLREFAIELPRDDKVRGGERRQLDLTRTVIELTRAVGKSDQSASRETRRRKTVDQERARLEGTVFSKSVEELQAELSALKTVAPGSTVE